jgi:hypothetical protein
MQFYHRIKQSGYPYMAATSIPTCRAFLVENLVSGAEAAAPIARKLIERMRQLGYVGQSQTAEKQIPPGKG